MRLSWENEISSVRHGASTSKEGLQLKLWEHEKFVSNHKCRHM